MLLLAHRFLTAVVAVVVQIKLSEQVELVAAATVAI